MGGSWTFRQNAACVAGVTRSGEVIGQGKAEKQEAQAHPKLDLAYNKRPFPILSCDHVLCTF